MVCLLQIFCDVSPRNKFENRSAFGRVAGRSAVTSLLSHNGEKIVFVRLTVVMVVVVGVVVVVAAA